MTRDELAKFAEQCGEEEGVTDPVALILDPSVRLVLVNDEFHLWDEVTLQFESIEN